MSSLPRRPGFFILTEEAADEHASADPRFRDPGLGGPHRAHRAAAGGGERRGAVL